MVMLFLGDKCIVIVYLVYNGNVSVDVYVIEYYKLFKYYGVIFVFGVIGVIGWCNVSVKCICNL